MKNFIIICLSVLFIITGTISLASEHNILDQGDYQLEEVPPPATQSKKDPVGRYYYGGSLGMTFGDYSRFSVTPLVGYKISPELSAGIELEYEYIKDKRYSSTLESHNYGGSLFSQYRFIPELYVHTEFKMMNYEIYYTLTDSKREVVPFIFLGVGYSKPISKNTWFNVQVLFDVLQDDDSPYDDWEPFISIGVGVGF